MIRLDNISDVKALQTNLRASLGSPAGKEAMSFLEGICGWYDFKETDPNAILIAHGKRQVLATIKTLLELSADQVVSIVKTKE